MGDLATRRAAGVSLLFAMGERPGPDEVRAALARCQAAAHVAHEGEGLLEIVVNGLAFDMADDVPVAAVLDLVGFEDGPDCAALDAVVLCPGPHLSGGLAMSPVARALLALAAELAVCLPASAVVWHPAATAIEPRHFSRIVLGWLAGGAFPAPGLVALRAGIDGSIVTRGLAHFVSQEVVAEGLASDEIGMVIGRIVAKGPVKESMQLTVGGRNFRVEPARDNERIWIWPASVDGSPLGLTASFGGG